MKLKNVKIADIKMQLWNLLSGGSSSRVLKLDFNTAASVKIDKE